MTRPGTCGTILHPAAADLSPAGDEPGRSGAKWQESGGAPALSSLYLQLQLDPGRVVVAAVASVPGAAVDERARLLVGEGRAQPDLVEQLVAGRLARLLEAWVRLPLARGGGVSAFGGYFDAAGSDDPIPRASESTHRSQAP